MSLALVGTCGQCVPPNDTVIRVRQLPATSNKDQSHLEDKHTMFLKSHEGKVCTREPGRVAVVVVVVVVGTEAAHRNRSLT